MFQSNEQDHEQEKPPQAGRHLFRFFVTVSLAAAVVVLLVAGMGLRFIFRTNVIEEAEKDAIRISTALRDTQIHHFIQAAVDQEGDLAIPADELAEVDREMRAFLGPFHIVKIKVYDTDMRIIYSTDPTIIGRLDPDNAQLAAALSGRPFSKHEIEEEVWDLAGEQRFDVEIVETYVPVFAPDGTVIGSVEIYKNVTPDLARANRSLTRAIVVLSTVILTVFGILSLIMHRATRTIRRQTVELGLSEEKYRHLFSTVVDAIIIFDPQTGRIIDMNDAAPALYGCSDDDLLEKSIEEIGVDVAHLSHSVLDLPGLASDRAVQGEHNKADGTLFAVEMSGGSFMADGREMMFVVVRDITECKRAEAEREKGTHEIERFNRLAVGRETRMIELKREVNEMARKAGIAPPYDLAFVEPAGGTKHEA